MGRGEESIYYWQEWRSIRDDGTIVMKARGYDQFGAHWTGWTEITPDDPDFGLWTWILAREDRFDKIISGKLLETIREEYRWNALTPGRAPRPASVAFGRPPYTKSRSISLTKGLESDR